MDGREIALGTVAPVAFTNSKLRGSRDRGIIRASASSPTELTISSSDSGVGPEKTSARRNGYHVMDIHTLNR